MPTISGFVLTKNAPRLSLCVESLLACCDEVVVVDSGSEPATLDTIRRMPVRLIEIPWRGFGDARRIAVDACKGEYCFFLDSDEHLTQPNIDLFRESFRDLTEDGYRVVVNDWATTAAGKRFVFRRHRRCKVFRRTAARYENGMIVHETPQLAARTTLPATVNHEYYDGALVSRAQRNQLYSVLWAVQNSHAFRRPPGAVKFVHWLKSLFVQGALFRGGADAFEVAQHEAAYHADKYRWLGRAELTDCITAYEEGRLDDVFTYARRLAAGN